MPAPDRTAFAALLTAHRKRLHLTQAELATRTDTLHGQGRAPRSVTERTIIALEHLTPGTARVPHQATVRSLAVALELEPGTRAWDRFVAAASNPHEAAASSPPDAEFIPAGREAQLDRLASVIDEAAGGTPGIALVTGPAGIGKTRLLMEACRRALDRNRGLALLWTQCPRRFDTMATHEPFRSMLGHLLGDPLAGGTPFPDEDRRLRSRRSAIARALARGGAALVGTLVSRSTLQDPAVLRGLDSAARLRLAAMATAPASQPVAPRDIDEALWHLLETATGAGPLVLAIEDLHWADHATLAAMECIVDGMAAGGMPLALLGSIRTGERLPGDPAAPATLSATLDRVTTAFPEAIVDLAPTVGAEQGRAFVEAAVARIQRDDLAGSLLARTGGMPLFVMSFLRLRETTADSIDDAIPAEVGAVFARQIRQMDPPARALLEAASVQGDEFLAEPALAAAGIAPEDWPALLDTALAGQLQPLGSQDLASGIPMHRYGFAHAMLHDHVTGTLSGLERSRLHLATADALVALLGESGHAAVEIIALQRELGGALDRAARSWVAAGDAAMLRADYLHARGLFQHARSLGIASTAPEPHTQALIGIGNCNRSLGLTDEARALLQEARREAETCDLHTVHANALVSLGALDFDAGRMADGAARFGEAIATYRLAGNLVEAGRATSNLSLTLHGMGRYDEAREHAERAIGLARESGSASVLASAEISLANCWLDLGLYERAIPMFEGGAARNDAALLTHYANVCLLNIALCHIECARWDEAEAMLRRVDAPDRKLVERMRSVSALNAGLIAEGRGDLDAARAHFLRARDIRLRLGQVTFLVDALAGLLRVATATGQSRRARTLLDDIEARIAATGYTGIEHLGRLFRALIDAHEALGSPGTAEGWLRRAIALLEERATGIADPIHRASYLTRPPAHRDLLDLARARGLAVPADAGDP